MPASRTSVEAELCCSLSLRAEDATSFTLAPGWQKVRPLCAATCLTMEVPTTSTEGVRRSTGCLEVRRDGATLDGAWGSGLWRRAAVFPGRDGGEGLGWTGGPRTLGWWEPRPVGWAGPVGEPDMAPTGGKSCRLRMSNLLSSGRSGGGGGGDRRAPAPLCTTDQCSPSLSGVELTGASTPSSRMKLSNSGRWRVPVSWAWLPGDVSGTRLVLVPEFRFWQSRSTVRWCCPWTSCSS